MKRPPAGLPPANSRKWHSRRMWDELGYLRVRSLDNPDWPRDCHWLAHVLAMERNNAPPTETAQYDTVIRAVRRYPHTASGRVDSDLAWDEVLTAIDVLLVDRQQRHLASVRRARARQESSSTDSSTGGGADKEI